MFCELKLFARGSFWYKCPCTWYLRFLLFFSTIPWQLLAPTRWNVQIQSGPYSRQNYQLTKLTGTSWRPTFLTGFPHHLPPIWPARARQLLPMSTRHACVNTSCTFGHVPASSMPPTTAKAYTQSFFSKAWMWSGHPEPGAAGHSKEGSTLPPLTDATFPDASNYIALDGHIANLWHSVLGPFALTDPIGSPSTADNPMSMANYHSTKTPLLNLQKFTDLAKMYGS